MKTIKVYNIEIVMIGMTCRGAGIDMEWVGPIEASWKLDFDEKIKELGREKFDEYVRNRLYDELGEDNIRADFDGWAETWYTIYGFDYDIIDEGSERNGVRSVTTFRAF